ncbi:MAG: hypothetical protein JWQ74_464 [Marmoricola sp.]|nr:hypothetical protein [Marmoricola sp.]
MSTIIDPTIGQLQEQLRASQENELLLVEQISDLEISMEDRGWATFASSMVEEFSWEGRRRIVAFCRLRTIADPLLKRGVNTRIGYIWGQGVQVRAKHGEDSAEQGGQDVNAVVQAFLDGNQKSLTGAQAQEENERALATDGQLYVIAFTDPLTGRVLVRVPQDDEITDVIRNPEDRDEPWYYVREYVETDLKPGVIPGSEQLTNRLTQKKVKVLHPAMGYMPAGGGFGAGFDGLAQRPNNINGIPIRWDAPILQMTVNRLNGWKYGIPDVYASLAWSRLYKEFLVDWATLTKSLAKISYQATGDTKRRGQAAADNARAMQSGDAGQTWISGPGGKLEAVSKSGATIDSQSGKPLAAMVAAGLDLPVTVLLADPGVTGARAVAETLDLPTVLAMGMRRLQHQAFRTELLEYVIEQAVIAPQGPLQGTLFTDDYGIRRVELAGDATTDLDWDWPPIGSVDVVQMIAAIVDADSTGLMPDPTTLRLLMAGLGVKDIDEEMKKLFDKDGNFVSPRTKAAANDRSRADRGLDPVDQ